MSLAEQIKTLNAQLIGQIPDDARDTVVEAIGTVIKELEDAGVEQASLKEGDTMPAFTLPNANGDTVSSAELLAKGPLVVSFYRGGWCPYCNLELKALQDVLPDITDLGASLVAVSPETPEKGAESAKTNDVTFEVLSDTDNKVAHTFGIGYELSDQAKQMFQMFQIDISAYNGEGTPGLPLPGTYVVGADGKIVKAFAPANHTERMEPTEVLAALRGTKAAAA